MELFVFMLLAGMVIAIAYNLIKIGIIHYETVLLRKESALLDEFFKNGYFADGGLTYFNMFFTRVVRDGNLIGEEDYKEAAMLLLNAHNVSLLLFKVKDIYVIEELLKHKVFKTKFKNKTLTSHFNTQREILETLLIEQRVREKLEYGTLEC